MPRVLNMYVYAPFFNGYFECARASPARISSTPTTRAASSIERVSGRGAIDPCFPAKIGIAHVHNLLFAKHAKKQLDYHLLPDGRRAAHAAQAICRDRTRARPSPATPETVKAAFTKEVERVRASRASRISTRSSNFHDRKLLAQQLFEALGTRAWVVARKRTGAPSTSASASSTAYEATSGGVRAKSSISSSAKIASASSCWRVRITTIPGLNHEILRRVPEARLPGVLAEHAADG